MHTFMFTADSPDELSHGIREQQSRFTPTLAIVFSSPSLDMGACVRALEGSGCDVFGASTAGEILTGAGASKVFEQSATCCLLDPDPSIFAVRLFPRNDVPPFELGEQAGRWAAGCFAQPAILLAVSGLTNNAEAIIRGMEKHLPTGTVIAGGVAADDTAFLETTVFTATSLTSDGIVVLAFDTARVSLSSFTTSGWTGIGVEMTVMSSAGNIVRQIDGKNPLDLVADYLNISKEVVVSTALNFPMLVQRPDGSEVLRTALSADYTTGALIYAGSVPEGSKIRFSSSFGTETIEKTIREMIAYYEKNPEADLVILFDCCARHQAAGAYVNDEISAIADLWKVPVIGFFTYGEIGHSPSGKCDLFNETLSLALLKFR
ncbi:domain of unknown function DUF1745 [Methanoregula boonei 6A8]|uniref:FIST C-domain domain-containing protein n=1 Tax=Methanoregula boonei (strain DSM 21154 / JCM 14090 / 6A8) TaxID=456442 RepID=A7I505_METB6|nr:FIST N-terminal domain-containing protein [Methanoregula boonei]ABS54816.1 domain of unknown function DUF1745 [Methanoregula boonei 6A8]